MKLIHSFKKEKNMKTLQKFGGFAALYMAAAHLIGIVIFLVILDYLSITDPTQKVALNVDKQMIVFSSNLLLYVFFGVALIAFSLAWSTSVTKSLTCFCEIRTDSTSSAARLMMAPAARAALMATLIMGWRFGDGMLWVFRFGRDRCRAPRGIRSKV